MRYRLLLTVAVAVAATDALTKAAAVALSRWMPIGLPGGWALQVVHNNGVAGGGGGGTILPAVFAVIAVVQITVILVASRHERGRPWAMGLGLLLGGAIGNLGEHWIFGYAVDWIRLPHPHPSVTFNLADVAVACGEVLLLTLLAARSVRTRTAVTP